MFLSIVILTFNSGDFIKRCLDSLFSNVLEDTEVIVVDNASTDKTKEILKLYSSKLRFIANESNLGSCAGRNIAIDNSSGDWILFLDCDIVLHKDFIEQIILKIKSVSGRVGAVQPLILKSDSETIYSCGIRLTFLRRFFDIGRDKSDRRKFACERSIFGACSAASVYRRNMIEQIKDQYGYFDERFFFLVEDVDLSWRARKKGWETLFFPGAKCIHAGNSSYFSKHLRQYLSFRNRYYMILKNENKYFLLLKSLFYIFYDVPRLVFLLFTNPYIYQRKLKLSQQY